MGAFGTLVSMIVLMVGAFAPEPAAAQGGVVCDYGSSKYRSCCRESYRNNPNMRARARADDIDACMDGRSPPTERRSDEKPSKPTTPPATTSTDTPSPKWGAGGRTAPSADLFRRLECATGACEAGCTGEEMAISAFCNVGSTPSVYNDGSIRCANSSGAEWPTVIICARKQ